MKEALRLASVPTVPVSHSVTQQHPLPQTSRPSPLTFPRLSPIFEPPNNTRRNRRLPRAPHGGKERSYLFRQQSRHRCILWTVLHIDGTRPDVRETQAALCWPGSVSRLFLCPIPKQHRCSMFRFFFSSRWLRLRYRLLSLLALHVGHAAATLALGALLSLPFVMYGLWQCEVLQ